MNSLGQPPKNNWSRDHDFSVVLHKRQKKSTDKDGKPVLTTIKARNYQEILDNISSVFMKSLLNGNNLDIVIKKFENYPVAVYNRDFNLDYVYKDNVVPEVLNILNKSIDKKLLVDTMKKVYLSNFAINKGTQGCNYALP